MHIKITEAHVTSVSADDDSVTARAEYRDRPNRLEADNTIPLLIGSGIDFKVEIERATRTAVAGAVAKLQAVVDGRFGSETSCADQRFERVPVGEKIEAGVGEGMVDLAAESLLAERKAEQSWRAAYKPIYQRLFGDMQVSIPTRLEMPAIESRIREIVDGRTSLTRQLKGAPGWVIGGVQITLEGVLQRSDRAFESLVRGIAMTR